MILPASFYNALSQKGVERFVGVPDSLLKAFCAYVSDNAPAELHTIAANEGGAIALAMGYHLATDKIPLVYMQNSGLGNTINPLLSLVDNDVYGTPMLLMIGWRGEPGKKDEPQHVKQGKTTLTLLEAMGIPYTILDDSEESIAPQLDAAIASARKSGGAHALIVKKGTFDAYALKDANPVKSFDLTREDAIQRIVDALDPNDIVISTTGMASRELFEYREDKKQGHKADFLTVGGMGHASQIALGIASEKPNRRVVCIDGDGAALMHLGALAISGTSSLPNFKHVVINNGAHDSVGGQPTVGFDISLPKAATACGYEYAQTCPDKSELTTELAKWLSADGPTLLEICVDKGNRKDLGRPTTTPKENKDAFMAFLKD